MLDPQPADAVHFLDSTIEFLGCVFAFYPYHPTGVYVLLPQYIYIYMAAKKNINWSIPCVKFF